MIAYLKGVSLLISYFIHGFLKRLENQLTRILFINLWDAPSHDSTVFVYHVSYVIFEFIVVSIHLNLFDICHSLASKK